MVDKMNKVYFDMEVMCDGKCEKCNIKDCIFRKKKKGK